MKFVTASIVIYKNDLQVLKKAAFSFLESVPDALLYMIDNSPLNFYERHFQHPRIKFIYNNKNIGFGAGHNIALRQVVGEHRSAYHIVLNPDVYFERDVIDSLLQYMDQNPVVGLVMPKVLYPDGRLQPLCRLLPTPATLFSRRFLGFNRRWINRINHWYEMHFSGYNKIMDVPFLSGCFMFIRTESLRKVGLFDERIFLYTEDTDLTRRIHKYYRTVFFPQVTIYHHHEKASYKNAKRLFQHTRSAITYFNKWGWFRDEERELINQRVSNLVQ